MNIFVLSKDPVEAAKMQCDKHVVKMVLESAQILCSAYKNSNIVPPYRITHYNHPCSIWARTSIQNYKWLLNHPKSLSDEYTKRYDKTHKSLSVINWCSEHVTRIDFPHKYLTNFALCMPEKYHTVDPVVSYREYYFGEKRTIAVWKHSEIPSWYIEKMNKEF